MSAPSASLPNLPLQAIGFVESCFREKFGIPRQPGLVSSARGCLVIQPPFHVAEAFTGLQQFSHIWVLFQFHQANPGHWKPRVRPPRLGGNQSLGVFASRSPFRPNSIGMSPVRLEAVEHQPQQTRLLVSGIDLVDGTPILDIKPYIPYVDAIADAQGGYADTAPTDKLQVEFTAAASARCQQLEAAGFPQLQTLIRALLATDPRPAYRQDNDPDPERVYGMRLYDFNVRWTVTSKVATLIAIDAA